MSHMQKDKEEGYDHMMGLVYSRQGLHMFFLQYVLFVVGRGHSKNKGRGTSLPERLTRCELINGGLHVLLKAAKQKKR